MAGSARSAVLIHAVTPELVSRFYEQALPATVLLAVSEHRVVPLADAQLIIHAIPAPYAERIQIAAPPAPREQQAI
jgi:hypothetical protein